MSMHGAAIFLLICFFSFYNLSHFFQVWIKCSSLILLRATLEKTTGPQRMTEGENIFLEYLLNNIYWTFLKIFTCKCYKLEVHVSVVWCVLSSFNQSFLHFLGLPFFFFLRLWAWVEFFFFWKTSESGMKSCDLPMFIYFYPFTFVV